MDAARNGDAFGTGRLEAFSDGVIAVAITLLVLDLRVPESDGAASLTRALGALWPNYLAYVISFLAIGIIWINHHTLMRRLARADRSVLALNLVLLMCIAVLPFTTSLMATYLDESGGRLAAVVYAGSFLVTSAVFLALERHVLQRRTLLLRAPMAPGERRAVLRRAALAPPAYSAAGLLGLVTPYLTLAVCVVMGLFYLAAPRRG